MKVSRAQLLRADRQSFIEMARNSNGALKARADGTLPLDDEFKSLHHNMEVMYFVLPVAGKGKGKGKSKENQRGGGKKRWKRKNEGHDKDEAPDPKKAKITRDPIPNALKGMHGRTPDNKPICFNYNLGKCKMGSKCKFLHVCCKPGCYKPHPMTEHASDLDEWLCTGNVVVQQSVAHAEVRSPLPSAASFPVNASLPREFCLEICA